MLHFHIGLWANMYGETSAYIIGSSLFADIKNPQTKYVYRSVALQTYGFPRRMQGYKQKIIAKTYYDCQNKSWLLHIIAGNKYR